MNGPQNYSSAVSLVRDARVAREHGDSDAHVDQLLAEALVKAVLANTAAILHERISDRVQSSSAWNEALAAGGRS